MFVGHVYKPFEFVFLDIVDRFYAGTLRTEDSSRAAATRQVLTGEIETLSSQLGSLRLEMDETIATKNHEIQQLQIENETLEQEVVLVQNEMNATQQELETVKRKLQEVFLDPTNDRCKAMCVQAFTYLCSFMFMNMGSGFNKFNGLRTFFLSNFGIDIAKQEATSRRARAKNPTGVIGQLRIKV